MALARAALGHPAVLAGLLVLAAYLYGRHAGAGAERTHWQAAAERARAEAAAIDAEAARRLEALTMQRIIDEEEADAADRGRIVALEGALAEARGGCRVDDAGRRRLLDVGSGARRPGAAGAAR